MTKYMASEFRVIEWVCMPLLDKCATKQRLMTLNLALPDSRHAHNREMNKFESIARIATLLFSEGSTRLSYSKRFTMDT